MSKDLLERAAAAVRDRYDGTSDKATRTEDRVLRALRAHPSHRNRVPLVAFPLVAALLASVAWGTVSESSRATVRSALHDLFTSRKAVATGKLARPAAAARSVPVAPSAPNVVSEPPLAEPSLSAAPSATLPAPASVRPRSSTSKPATLAPQTQPVAPPSASEAEINALYGAAHHAQFSGNDPALAVDLWDRYLAAAPNGSLSPEARYNRAIALARLGRKAEAAAALEPFARGDYGAYRQNEANALLNALRPSAVPP
jgi:hypothetical protein